MFAQPALSTVALHSSSARSKASSGSAHRQRQVRPRIPQSEPTVILTTETSKLAPCRGTSPLAYSQGVSCHPRWSTGSPCASREPCTRDTGGVRVFGCIVAKALVAMCFARASYSRRVFADQLPRASREPHTRDVLIAASGFPPPRPVAMSLARASYSRPEGGPPAASSGPYVLRESLVLATFGAEMSRRGLVPGRHVLRESPILATARVLRS